jgi:predicted  nucleic acid-binding Zn-ribbon protein
MPSEQSLEVQVATLHERVRNLSAYTDAIHEELKALRATIQELASLPSQVEGINEDVKTTQTGLSVLKDTFERWKFWAASILGGGAVLGWIMANWRDIFLAIGRK